MTPLILVVVSAVFFAVGGYLAPRPDIKFGMFGVSAWLLSRLALPVLLIGLLVLPSVGCAANKPPNLNPEATKAWYGTQIIKNLDRVRDAANDAHNTTPPLIDAPTTLKIVEWHQSAIKIVHDAAIGWREALTASLNALQKNLPSATWKLIQPYIALVNNLLREV